MSFTNAIILQERVTVVSHTCNAFISVQLLQCVTGYITRGGTDNVFNSV
jgi:hypothetical protein